MAAKAPFNVSVIDPDEYVKRKGCLPVTSHSVYEPSTQLFHPDGLFSEVIFGQMGSNDRLIRRGYIDLHTTLINPHLYKQIMRLKGMYKDVVAGKKYAYFDKDVKDLAVTDSNDPNGNTGYSFFLSVLPKIEFKKNASIQRINRVNTVEMYKDRLFITKMLVLPAGVRDVKVTNGRASSDEINKIYLALLSLAKSLPESGTDDPMYDVIRYQMQQKVMLIYEYIRALMKDKHGFAQGKYTARAVVYANRNVITAALTTKVTSANSPAIFSMDESEIPLYQAMKGAVPLVVYHLKTKFFDNAFDSQSNTVLLVNPVTKESSYYEIDDAELRKYTTLEGIETIVDDFRHTEFAFEPVLIKLKEPVVIEGQKYEALPLSMVYDYNNHVTIGKSYSDFADSYSKRETYKDILEHTEMEIDPESFIVEGSSSIAAFGMDIHPKDFDVIATSDFIKEFKDQSTGKVIEDNDVGIKIEFKNYTLHITNKGWGIKNDDDFNKFKQENAIKITNHYYVSPAQMCAKYAALNRLKDKVKLEFLNTIVPHKAYYRPITIVEMCYIAAYTALHNKCCTVTRYPVLNMQNLVPCKIHLMTTTPGRVVTFQTAPGIPSIELPEYPVIPSESAIKVALKQSMSLHPVTLDYLDADHDGDTVSLNILLSDEATKEVHEFLDNKISLLTMTGDLIYNLSSKWVVPMSFLFATSHKIAQ